MSTTLPTPLPVAELLPIQRFPKEFAARRHEYNSPKTSPAVKDRKSKSPIKKIVFGLTIGAGIFTPIAAWAFLPFFP